MPEKKSDLLNLPPNDPRVTAAVIKRIREMPFAELEAMLAYRSPGVVERAYPDPTPTTREELLRKQAERWEREHASSSTAASQEENGPVSSASSAEKDCEPDARIMELLEETIQRNVATWQALANT